MAFSSAKKTPSMPNCSARWTATGSQAAWLAAAKVRALADAAPCDGDAGATGRQRRHAGATSAEVDLAQLGRVVAQDARALLGP